MNEVPLLPLWVTLSLTAWAAAGPLIGIFIGNYLSRRSQKEHWTNDNARQECRELISTISNTFLIVLKYHAASATGIPITGPHDATEMRELAIAEQNSIEIFYSRLFISDELNKRKIRDRWVAAIRKYEDRHEGESFKREFGVIVAEIREIAKTFIA